MGITVMMSYDEVRSRVRQINKIKVIKRQQEQKVIIEQEYRGFQDKIVAYIPTICRDEFEKLYFDLSLYDDEDPYEKELSIKRCRSVWKKAQAVILDLKIEPFNFFNCSSMIYDYFYKREYSPSYVRKVI